MYIFKNNKNNSDHSICMVKRIASWVSRHRRKTQGTFWLEVPTVPLNDTVLFEEELSC